MLFLAVFVVGPIIAGVVEQAFESSPKVFAARLVWEILTGED